MAGVSWEELAGAHGVYRMVVDGKPTAVTSLVDWTLPKYERLQQLKRNVLEDDGLRWIPGWVLGGYMDDIEQSSQPPAVTEPLPDGYVAPPIPWTSATLIGFGEINASPLARWFYPIVERQTGELALEPGEEALFSTSITPPFVWWAEPDRTATDSFVWMRMGKDNAGLSFSMPMQGVDGWPTLVVTSRRLVMHGTVERSGDVNDRVLLGTFLPTVDRLIHLTRETQRAFGRSGFYWGTQIRHEWLRSLVIRHTVTAKPKKLLDRLMVGPGGESTTFLVEVSLPNGYRCEIELDKGEPGILQPKGTHFDADHLLRIVSDAVTGSPMPLAVADEWDEHTRPLEIGTETHRYLHIAGSMPVSFPPSIIRPDVR